MQKIDIFVGILVVFVCLFIASSAMRMSYNLAKGELAPLGIRVSQWISFAGLILTAIGIIFI